MKRILFFLLAFSLTTASYCQDIDSTQIKQTITIKQKYVLHFLSTMDWSNTDVINVLNQFRPQYDTAGKETSDKLITISTHSGTFADGMQRLSQLPEGQATQYNEEMMTAIFPQLTNGWLINRMLQIRNDNWAARDSRNHSTAIRIEQIDIVP